MKITLLILAGLVIAVGGYVVVARYIIPTNSATSLSSVPAVPGQNVSSSVSTTPSVAATTTFQARIIDVYPNRKVMTVQTTQGGEEIVLVQGVTSSLPSSLVRGMALNVSAAFDQNDGIYYLDSFNIAPTSSLQFQDPLSGPIGREASATNVDASGLNLSFGASVGLPKPAYLVFISPEGEILAPHFTSMIGAEYTVDGKLDTVQDALQASQYITIPIAARGLWAVKFISLPGADLSTVFGFTPPLPTMTLGERDDKLWYFNNVQLDTIGKIQAAFAQCDSACKAKFSKQTDYLLLGQLANPTIQQKLFGRTGTPYTLEGYRLGEQETFFGGITCSNIYQSPSSSMSLYKMSLYDWEVGALVNTAGLCNRYSIIDNEGDNITVYEVVQ